MFSQVWLSQNGESFDSIQKVSCEGVLLAVVSKTMMGPQINSGHMLTIIPHNKRQTS